MLLNKFLKYFARVSSNNPNETRIEFRVENDDTNPFIVKTVIFDVNENKWIVELK